MLYVFVFLYICTYKCLCFQVCVYECVCIAAVAWTSESILFLCKAACLWFYKLVRHGNTDKKDHQVTNVRHADVHPSCHVANPLSHLHSTSTQLLPNIPLVDERPSTSRHKGRLNMPR